MANGVTECTLDIHPEVWDLGGTMTARFYNKSDPSEPTGVIHEDETLLVKVTVTLTGRIVNYLCKTQIGVGWPSSPAAGERTTSTAIGRSCTRASA
jgi:hypothetical protein